MNKNITTLILSCICFVFLFQTPVLGKTNFDFFFKSSEQYKDVKVKRVVNVNTIVLDNGFERGETIQLIGLKGILVEKKKEEVERDKFGFIIDEEVGPLTPVKEKAIEYVKELLEGKMIRLEFDSDKNSKEHHTLAYVFTNSDDVFINAEIIRHGYAQLQISPPNMKYAKELREAYKEARKEKRGFQGDY